MRNAFLRNDIGRVLKMIASCFREDVYKRQDLSGSIPFYAADFRGPIGIVIGSEGNGMGPLIARKCDFIVTIPMRGAVSSLNASVAAGVVPVSYTHLSPSMESAAVFSSIPMITCKAPAR